MRKPDFAYAKTVKGADQLRSNYEADQRLCFCYTESTIPLLSKSKISSRLAIFCDCIGWFMSQSDIVRNPKDQFSHEAAHTSNIPEQDYLNIMLGHLWTY